MSDADALLRAIITSPDDDAPRLVYADFLDEHGDPPRAAFIRAQVQLARLPLDHTERPRLIQTERNLGRAHRDAWTAWVPRWTKAWEFRRGFLEWARCDAATFLARADELRSRTPLTGVRLDGPGEIAVPMFRSRALEGLQTLTLSVVNVPSGTWEHLATSPYLGRLVDLDLSSNAPAPELVTALIHSTGLGSVRSLRLNWCTLGDEQTIRLVRHPWVGQLAVLDLSSNHIGSDAGWAVARSPHLDGLEALVLRTNPVLRDVPVIDALRRRFGDRLRV